MIAREQFLQHVENESSRHRQNLPPQPRAFAKWCAYALFLLLPGSFEVLALRWLYQRYAMHRARRLMVSAS